MCMAQARVCGVHMRDHMFPSSSCSKGQEGPEWLAAGPAVPRLSPREETSSSDKWLIQAGREYKVSMAHGVPPEERKASKERHSHIKRTQGPT